MTKHAMAQAEYHLREAQRLIGAVSASEEIVGLKFDTVQVDVVVDRLFAAVSYSNDLMSETRRRVVDAAQSELDSARANVKRFNDINRRAGIDDDERAKIDTAAVSLNAPSFVDGGVTNADNSSADAISKMVKQTLAEAMKAAKAASAEHHAVDAAELARLRQAKGAKSAVIAEEQDNSDLPPELQSLIASLRAAGLEPIVHRL